MIRFFGFILVLEFFGTYLYQFVTEYLEVKCNICEQFFIFLRKNEILIHETRLHILNTFFTIQLSISQSAL